MKKSPKAFSSFRFKSSVLFAFGISILFYSCSPTRHLKESEQLLNKITIKSSSDTKFNSELKSIAKQQPNRKLLGIFRLYLGIYNLYYQKTDSKIKDKLGEPPVIYDSTLNQSSLDLMSRFLNNKGYYENTVSLEVLPNKKRKSLAESKKVKMVFTIEKRKRYLISRLDKEISDPAIKAIVEAFNTNQNLKIYDPFDLDKLKEERVRIERLLKNFGYYKFSREYVVFEADTSKRTKSAALKMVIKNPTINYFDTDSLIEGRHQTYTVNNVQVRINGNQNTQFLKKGDSTMVDSMLFINWNEKEFNKKAISRITYIRPQQLFSLKTQEETYRNLSSLRLFSNVSIQYEPDFYANENGLNAIIDLKPRKQKSLTIETEGTNNGGNLGINGTVNFQNNNTFKGAEILNISFNGGLEAQTILTGADEKRILGGFLPFNTLEFGPEINLEIPRFLLPINADRFSPRGNPRTTFNASYNLQERPDYRRDVSKTYIAYSWNETVNKTHVIQPFDLSYIKLDPSNSFSAVLESIQNPFLRNSYTDNLILASKYSFIYNSKNSNRLKNYVFFRSNIETAGNVLSLLTDEKEESVNSDGTVTRFAEIAGIRFAQYVRADIDFRYYQNFNLNKLVYRLTSGLGLPYGNSIAMPFEKSFYAGGANGIRAWRARELGPGNLPDSVEQNIDQIGNMNLEVNVEFRFPITNVLEGAAFVDAGNIWNYSQKGSRNDTQFTLGNAWNGTAVGFGAGIRLNFSFFILRFDAATKLKDPSVEDPNQLSPQWRQTNLNLGIGYPF